MNEDVLIPKMTPRSKSKKKMRLSFLNIALILFCTILITGASFVNLDIKHYILPTDLFTNKNLVGDDFVFRFFIIPQIPIIMFICSLLERKMAMASILLYIIIGLTIVPIFALGGGITYFFEYGFGYILAYVPAVVLVKKLLNKYSFLDMLKATFAGVFTIHILGILYMMLIALFKHSGGDFITGWIIAQSGLKILYDLILSYLLVLIGKYLHNALKFVLE